MDWHNTARQQGFGLVGRTVCCYPRQAGFIAELASSLSSALSEAAPSGKPRVLFSAHGLPQKIVERGDPYRWQVEQTAAAVVEALRQGGCDTSKLDWLVSYQSRVGPLEWIKPYTDAEIERAGRERVPLVIVPLAFVSEHSETLVELDIEYRKLAEASGVPLYLRVPTVGTGGAFIDGLADLVVAAVERGQALDSAEGGRICPATCNRCALAGLPQQGRAGGPTVN